MPITETITSTINRTLDRLDVTKLTHVDMSNLDIRKLELPKFELPKFELPKFELPELQAPAGAERAAAWARDAAYVGVGAAVVVGQEIGQRTRTAAETVAGAVTDAVATASDAVVSRVRQVTDSVR